MRDELKLALEQHERGLLDQAAEAYRHLLAAQPDHADAMHLLGVVAYQQGDPVRAAEWIGRAIAEPGCRTLSRQPGLGLSRHGPG